MTFLVGRFDSRPRMVLDSGSMMTDDNEFQYFHTHQSLARQGLVAPVRCTCGQVYVTLSRNDALILWCPADDRSVTPGLAIKRRVEQEVHLEVGEL